MSPQESITRLRAARAEVAGTTPANPQQKTAQQELLQKIDQRIRVCEQDRDIRQEFGNNKKLIESIDKQRLKEVDAIERHDALKRELFAKYKERPLTLSNLSPGDQKRYLESRAARDAAAQRSKSLDEDRKKLSDRQSKLQDDYKELRESMAVGGKLPATPTDAVSVPCLEKLAGDFEPKQRRQAGGKEVYPGHQHYGNCGIQSVGQVIAGASGTKPDERAMLDQAVKDGNADDVFLGRVRRALFDEKNDDSGGTNAKQRKAILAKNGVDSKIVKTTRENLAMAIRGNKGIVANADAGELWNDTQASGGGHAILVYDGDFDENGNLTHVYINDTGQGEQGRKMTIDEFMAATDAKVGGSSLNVTKDPIW